MNKKNYLKIILPVVAILVIAESVFFVSSLSKNRSSMVGQATPTIVPRAANKLTQTAPTVFDMSVNTKGLQMKVGTSYQVEVKSVSRSQVSLDAVNVYVKFDPTAFDVSNLVFDKKLPSPTFSKISLQKSVVVVNYLISEKNGLVVKRNESLTPVRFTVKPKKVGNYVFEISSGNGTQESVTMFVENATSKALPYLSNKLTVNVLK